MFFFLCCFRELPLTSSDPSSSSSTTLRTLRLQCRCIILHLAPLDKVGRRAAADTEGAWLYTHPFRLDARWEAKTLLSLLPDEFARAVYVATGLKLTRHLVNTIFKIFDVDHDDQLSYKEFIGIMKDRLHRGARVRNSVWQIQRWMLLWTKWLRSGGGEHDWSVSS